MDWFVSVRQHRTRSAATSGNAGSVSTNQTGEEGNDSDDVICPSTSRDNSWGQYVRSLPASPRVLSDNSASPRVLSDNSDSDYRPPAVPSPSRRPTARLPKRRRKPGPTRDDNTGPSNNTPGPTRDDNRREHITGPSNNTRGYTSDPSDDEDYHPASELRRRWPTGESSRARRGSGQRASGKDSGQRARASQRRRSVILVSDSESGGEDASLRARLDSRLAKRRLARQAGEGVGGSESEGPVTNEIPGPSSFEDSSNMSSRVGDMGDSATRVGAMLGSSNRLSRVGTIGGTSINSSLPISYTALPMYPFSSVVRPSTSAGNREAEWPLEVSDSDSSIESTRPGRSKTRREKSSQNELSSPAGRSKKSRSTEKSCKKSTKKINTNKEKSSRSTSHERSSTARSTKKSKSESSHKSKPDKSTKTKGCERRSSGERSSEYTNVTKSTNTGKKSKTKMCRKAKETTDSSPETSIKTKKSDRSSSEKSRKTKKSTISERSTQKSKRSQSSDSDTETPSSQRPTRLCKNQRPNFIASDSDDTSVSESEHYASNIRHSGPNSNEQSSGVFGARSGTSRKDAQYSRDSSPNSNEARSVKLGTRPTAKGRLAISSESDSDFGEELSAPHRESRKSENVEVREDSGTRSSGDIRQDSCDLGPKSSKRDTETRAKGGHLAIRNVHSKGRKTSSSKNKRLEDTKENSYGNSKGGRKSGREKPESSRVRPKKTKKRKKKSLRSAKKRKYVSDTSSEETDEESENDDFSHTDSFEEDNDDENGGSTLGGTSTGGRNGKVREERRRERGTGGGRPLKSVSRGQQQCEETDIFEEAVNERTTTSKAVGEGATTFKAVSERATTSKAVSERANTSKAVSERATTSKAVSERATTSKAVSERANTSKAVSERATTFKAVSERATTSKAVSERANTSKAVSERATTSKAVSERATTSKAVSERANTSKAVSERATTSKAVSERATTSKAVSERATTSKAVSERANTSKAVSERATTSKAVSERATTSKAVSERANTSKAVSERATTSKAVSERATTSKAVGEKSDRSKEAVNERATTAKAVSEKGDRSKEAFNERADTSKAVSERTTTSKAVSEKGDRSNEAFNERADTSKAVSERATTSKTVSEKACSKRPDGVKETVNKRENYDKRPDGFKETVNKRGNSVENGTRNERVVETADCTLESIEGSSNFSSSSIEDGDFQGVRASCDPSDSEDSSEQALDRAKYCRVVIENLANTLKNRETSIGSAAVRENCEVPSDDSLEQAEALDRAKYCRVVIEDLANTIRNGSGLGDNQTVTAPLRETQSPSEPFQTFASALRRVKDEVNPSDASPLNDVNVKHEMSTTEGEFQAETNINEIANPGSNEIAEELAMNIPKIDETVDLKRENESEEEKRGKDNAKKRSESDHEAIENDGTDRRRKRKERKQMEKDQDGKRHRKDHREKRNVQRISGNSSQDRIYRGNNDRGEENFEEGHSQKDHQNRNCRGNDHRKGEYLENDQKENQPKQEQNRHGRKRLENRSKSPSEASSDEFASNESDEFDLPQRFMHGSDLRSKPESTTASEVETSTYKELKSSRYDKTASGYVETSGYNETKSSRHEETSGYNEPKSSRYNEPKSSRHEETSGYNEPKSSRYNEPKYSRHEETSGYNEPKSSRYNEPESSRHKTSSRFSVDNERPTCSKYLIADSERALPGIASFFCAESAEVDLTETPEVDTTAEQLSKKDTVQRSENGEYMLAMQMTEGQWLETSMKERGQWPSGGRASRPLTREDRWPQEDGTSINERDQRPLSIEEIINVEALDDEMVWKVDRRKAEQSGNRETLGDGVDGGAKQGTSVENGANGLECHANRVESCANPGRSNPVENAVSEDEPDVIIVNTPDVHAEILVLSSDDETPRPLGLFSDRQSSYQHKKFQKAQRNSSARTDRENSHGDSNQETSGRSINSTSNEGSDVRAYQQTRDEGDPNSYNQQNPIGSIDDAFGTSGSIGGSSLNTPRTIEDTSNVQQTVKINGNTTYDDASNVQHALNGVVASKDVSPVDQIVHDISEDEVDVVGEINRVVRVSSRAIANTMSLLVRNSAILIQPSNQSTNLSETNQLVSSTRCASTNVSTKTTNQASSTSQSPSTNDSETNQSTSTKCTDISNVSSRTNRLAPRETNASNVYPSGSANAYSDDDEIIEVGSPETLEILSTIETLANDIKDTVECMREHGKQKRRRQQRQRDRHGCRENNLGCRESNHENNIGCIESNRENNLGCRESNPGCSRENTHGCREKQVKRQNQEQLGESQVEACTRGVHNERLHQKSQEANGTPNEGINVQEERTKHGGMLKQYQRERLNKLLGEDRFQDVENKKTIDNSNAGESKSEVDVHNTNEVNNKCDINGKDNKVSVHNIVMDAKTVETDISNIRNTKMTDDISDINIGNTKMTADISDINIGNTKLEDDLKDINIDPTESIFQEHASVEAMDAKPSTSNLHEHSRNEISNVSRIIKQLTSHHDEMTIEGKPNTNDDLPRKNKPIEPKPDEGNVSSAARTIGKHLQSVEYARIPFLTVEDEDVVLVTQRNTDLDVVDVDGSDDEPIICLESHGSQPTKPTGLDSLTYGRANQRHSMFSKRRYLKPGPDRLQTVSGPENDDVICVEDDVISVTDSQPMSDIDVVNTSPEALREIEAKEANRLDDSQSIQSTSASKSYIRKVLKWNRFWSEHKGSLGHVQPEGVTSASDDQMVTYRADNRGESFSGERHAGFTGEGSLSAVQTSPSGFDETAGGGRTDRRPFEESCSPSSWPGSGTALTSPVNYTIYENHTKQVVATRLVCDGEGRDSAERGSGRIMEITTKETYDVVKIAHKKKSQRIRTHALLGDGMSHALLGNQTRAVVSEENAMSHAPRQDSVVRASSSQEHHSVAESQERHGCRSPGIRHSCTKDRYPKSSSHGRSYTAPVTMETLSREPTDDPYRELGSYYTPMDNRYLQYYHGYKDYKKRSSLYREEEETRQHSAHSENERELPSRDEKHVKCEVKSSSDVNVDEDSRGYHDDGCVVVKKKRKHRDRSSSDETNASTDSSVSPLKKRKRDSSRKKRKHSRKHSRHHGNETRHRKKSKHSRYHGDKVCVKRSKSPAHSSRSVSICSSQSKACSSKSSTFSSQSKSSNLSSQSKSSDRSSQSKSSNLSSQSKGRSPKCSTVSSQSKSSERSSQSKPCKRLKLCDSDVKRRSHREKRFKFQSDAESDSDRKPPRASSTECDYRDAKTDSSRKRSKKHRHKQKRSCSPNHRSKRCSSSVSENDSSGFR
ncbi:hypothetical protein M8J75_004347 [Diaphorina citri]|nr:hypothetical protein M8J75_004347 [Diaphorina citri]